MRVQKLDRRVHELASIRTPETLPAWHRRLLAQEYDGGKQRGPGRSHTLDGIPQMGLRMSTENRDWGYRRIQAALTNLGHEVAGTTTADILKEHGLGPSPERNPKTTWKEFLAQHWGVIAAADFLTVEA